MPPIIGQDERQLMGKLQDYATHELDGKKVKIMPEEVAAFRRCYKWTAGGEFGGGLCGLGFCLGVAKLMRTSVMLPKTIIPTIGMIFLAGEVGATVMRVQCVKDFLALPEESKLGHATRMLMLTAPQKAAFMQRYNIKDVDDED